jgi:Mg2+ and Co2+ transporter CorA
MSDLFRHSACSFNQMVNMLKLDIEDALRTAHRHETLSLADLRYKKDVLDEHTAYLRDVVDFLTTGYKLWSVSDQNGLYSISNGSKQSTENAKIADITDETREELLKDFRTLLYRVEKLASRCLDGTQIILSGAQLRESQKGIEQAEEVKMLTILVFFFAPLSFVTSIFSMAFVQLQWQQGLPAFLVVSFTLTVGLGIVITRHGRYHVLQGLSWFIFW